MTEDKMVGWHHQLDGHGFGWTPGVGAGLGGLAVIHGDLLSRITLLVHKSAIYLLYPSSLY